MSTEQKTSIAIFNHGGGIRGLIPARIMTRIEEMTGLPMSAMVDIFAGPSTGAILNAALNRPNQKEPDKPAYKAENLVYFYERNGAKIFPPDRFRDFRGIVHDFNNRTLKLNQLNALFRHGHYDPGNLSKALRAMYGETRLSETLSSLIIPTYNIDGEQLEIVQEVGESLETPAHTKNNFIDHGGHAVWLKNIKTGYPEGQINRTPDVSMYDAVMASAAAPTYFPCHHFDVTYPDRRGKRAYTGIDGVIFDNPCISYLGAIRRHVPEDHKLIMIVLGTGYTNRSIKKEDWNRYGSLGVVDPVNDLPLINIFFHASESALMDSFEEEMGNNLYIFNKSMLPDINKPDNPSVQIDDASPENLKRLARFTDELLEEHKGKFEAVCHLLVNRRDRRQEEQQRTLKAQARKTYFRFAGKRDSDGKN
ncbi:MAG: patatin-like phospholipase family protein [Rhodospirillales bacterium]|nr:patatin-like phospholipase family protein [Rhodospirillales bacterium]